MKVTRSVPFIVRERGRWRMRGRTDLFPGRSMQGGNMGGNAEVRSLSSHVHGSTWTEGFCVIKKEEPYD